MSRFSPFHNSQTEQILTANPDTKNAINTQRNFVLAGIPKSSCKRLFTAFLPSFSSDVSF